jgi:hypothetical protein
MDLLTSRSSPRKTRWNQCCSTPDHVPEVNATVRLTALSRMYCHTYPDSAPVVSITDAHVKVAVSVPDPDQVTGQDVEHARQLAALLARYVAELEQLASTRTGSVGRRGKLTFRHSELFKVGPYLRLPLPAGQPLGERAELRQPHGKFCFP